MSTTSNPDAAYWMQIATKARQDLELTRKLNGALMTELGRVQGQLAEALAIIEKAGLKTETQAEPEKNT